MYRIAVFTADSNCMWADIDVEVRSKKKAIKEYNEQVSIAFNGETVICYNNNEAKGYPDIMPQLVVSKKRDWRLGEDDVHDNDNHRKQYLKYKYLNKIK